jgi:hypothetical protein
MAKMSEVDKEKLRENMAKFYNYAFWNIGKALMQDRYFSGREIRAGIRYAGKIVWLNSLRCNNPDYPFLYFTDDAMREDLKNMIWDGARGARDWFDKGMDKKKKRRKDKK